MKKLFYTAYLVNNWIDIVDKHFYKIRLSGLMSKLDEIFIYAYPKNYQLDRVVKNYTDNYNVKVNITYLDENQYELATLKSLQQNYGDYNLYMHSKGVSKLNDSNYYQVMQWNQYMTDFNVFNHDYCIKKLNEGYDAVGVEFKLKPFIHYSGNFWWTSGQHIQQLKNFKFDLSTVGELVHLRYTIRHTAEMFVASIPGRYCCMYESGVDLYYDIVKNSDYNIVEKEFLT